jgi:two-component system cell cycle response regulator PopA
MSAPVQARVLILARDDGLAGPLAEGLDRMGWRTVTARSVYAGIAALADLQIEAAIVDIASYGDEAGDLALRLKAASGGRRLPIIGIGQPTRDDPLMAFDLTLAAPLYPSQAVFRLESLVRTATAQEEFELRAETFAERGRRLEPPEESGEPWRVLAIGEPTTQFLALSNALTKIGAEVVGAFTAYTAFDYLHDQPFEAVVLWAGDDPAEAISIAAGMRRNSRLYHIPVMLYLRPGDDIGQTEVFHRGVSDVASADASESDTASRVVELAKAYRRQATIRIALNRTRSSGLMDAATGLFTRELFAAHLARLTRSARQRNRPLSICVLRINDQAELAPLREGGWMDRAAPQIGSMIGRLVRAEDTAARLGAEAFALALPATRLASGRAAAERIAAVIGCTAFDAGDGRPPFVVEFEIGVAEVDPAESAAMALERAANRNRQAKAS